jgi:HEAT repeat protein
VRASAAWALGEIEHRRAVPALIAALKDGDALVRRSAARALGSTEDPSAIPALTELLRADADGSVRAAAAWALGEIAG